MAVSQLLRAPAEIVLLAVTLLEGLRVKQTYPVNDFPLDEHTETHRHGDPGVFFQAAALNDLGIFLDAQTIRNGVFLAEIGNRTQGRVVGKGRDRTDGTVGVGTISQLFQPAGRYHRVGIQQHHIPGRVLQAAVDCSGKSQVPGILQNLDPRLGKALQIRIHGRIGTLVVDQEDPVRVQIRMPQKALYAFFQVIQGVVHRDDNIDTQIFFHRVTFFPGSGVARNTDRKQSHLPAALDQCFAQCSSQSFSLLNSWHQRRVIRGNLRYAFR